MDKYAPWLDLLASTLLLLLIIAVTLLCINVIAIIALKLFDLRRLINQKSVLLELTPPAQTSKTPEATQRLFSVLHGLENNRSWKDKLLRRNVVLSLEIVSTRADGIRYLLRVPENEAPTVEQTILSYIPDAKVKPTDDYLPGNLDYRKLTVLDFKQTGHFAYPLITQEFLGQHDPMSYLTGTMTKLKPNELIAYQIVFSPADIREADSLANRILHNEELINQLGKRNFPIVEQFFNALNTALFSVIDGISSLVHNSPSQQYKENHLNSHHQLQVAAKTKPARVLSAFEQELAELVHNKLNQPLFKANVRALIFMESKERARQRAKGIRDWMASLGNPKYQSLKARYSSPHLFKLRYRLFTFRHRMPALISRNSSVISASEIAELYHFPHAQTVKTENVIKSLSKTLPAPISLKGNAKFDVFLGRNHHHGTSTEIGLTNAERERHVYIIGGTGNGKTTMLEYGIVQDIRNGKGVAVIDPHGDLAEKLLKYIPENRINDVVYFNPSDLGYPIGLNILELPEDIEGDELLDAKDFITEAVISIMRKTFSDDDTGGHRIEYVLRNTVQTALTIKGATLFTVFDLLTDTKYRKRIVRGLENQKLRNFWKNEFSKAGDFQRVKMAAGVTSKIGRFQFSASAERIMSQPKSTINFEDILDGKILICNFAKGLIGEDTSELFGISTLAKLQLAAYRRVKKKQIERKPFYLYVDEFQNFATMSFVQMLSEARKYKVFLTMAEQSTSQQDDKRMVNTILANVGTIVCFRSGNPMDELLMLPLFNPYVQEGEIANLPTFNFYARLSAVTSQEPVSGVTLLLRDEGSEEVARKVISASRYNYAKKYVSQSSTIKHTGTTDEKISENKREMTVKKLVSARPGDD